MSILKVATDSVRAELFSSAFFAVFGLGFLIAAAAFWHLGKTDVARGNVWPLAVAGVLLLVVGAGLVFSNQSRLTTFPGAYEEDPAAFVESEIARTDKALGEYKTIVFRVMPVLVAVAALLLLVVDKPVWRASCAAAIGVFLVIIFIDTGANARLLDYKAELESHRQGASPSS